MNLIAELKKALRIKSHHSLVVINQGIVVYFSGDRLEYTKAMCIFIVNQT